MNKKETIHIIDDELITPLGFGTEANLQKIKHKVSAIQQHFREEFSPIPFFASLFENEKINAEFLNLSTSTNFTKLEKALLLAVGRILERNQGLNLVKTILIISTTKGNVELLENANEKYIQQSKLFNLGKTIQRFFKFPNSPITVSNACISGGLAISVGKRLLEENTYENALIVGGDVISKFTLSGFNSLQALDNEICKPYAKDRKGINLGEGAASMLLSNKEKSSIKIVGEATANDANHISGPSRTGHGLVKAIENAIKEANISSEEIGLISAHGTATLYNDAMEAIAFERLKLQQKPLTSYKAFYGHTFGASALIESVLTVKSLQQNFILPSLNSEEIGVEPVLNVNQNFVEQKTRFGLKTASGFGGSNFAMLFENMDYGK